MDTTFKAMNTLGYYVLYFMNERTGLNLYQVVTGDMHPIWGL
jgi:hypothetical protein